MQHNTIAFAGTNPARTLTLVAAGTMWPNAIIVDGETWEKTEFVRVVDGIPVRDYQHTRFPRQRVS